MQGLHLTKMNSYLSIFILSAFTANAMADPVSNCKNNEQIFFSCTAEKKIMSICASPRNSEINYLEYRFSKAGKDEFIYRVDSSDPKKRFLRTQVIGSSSASTMIWFDNGGYVYILNDPLKGNPSVSVRKSGKEIGRTQCTGNFAGDVDMPNKNIQQKSSSDYFNLLR